MCILSFSCFLCQSVYLIFLHIFRPCTLEVWNTRAGIQVEVPWKILWSQATVLLAQTCDLSNSANQVEDCLSIKTISFLYRRHITTFLFLWVFCFPARPVKNANMFSRLQQYSVKDKFQGNGRGDENYCFI